MRSAAVWFATIPILIMTTNIALAYEDRSLQFANLIQNSEYKKAYALLSPQFKLNFSEVEFIERQEQVKSDFLKQFGTNKIKRLEKVLITSPQPALNEQSLKRVLLFWKKNKENTGSFGGLFQFIFENEKAVLFQINSGAEGITNYEFLPELQKTLSSPNNPFQVKIEKV